MATDSYLGAILTTIPTRYGRLYFFTAFKITRHNTPRRIHTFYFQRRKGRGRRKKEMTEVIFLQQGNVLRIPTFRTSRHVGVD